MNSCVQLLVVSLGLLSLVTLTYADFTATELEYYQWGHVDCKGEVKFEETPASFCQKVKPTGRTPGGGEALNGQLINLVSKGTVVVADLIKCFFGSIDHGTSWRAYTKSPRSGKYHEVFLDRNAVNLKHDPHKYWVFEAVGSS